ncbi:MAG: hypothetical protein V1856_02725 [Candidatus Liptonbacteria bacterium]
MAIITEEKQSSVGLMSFVVWLFVLVIIGVGAYYIFFKIPSREVGPTDRSEDFQRTEALAGADLNAKPVVDGLVDMKSHVLWEEPEKQGRPNPFLPL